MKRWWEEKGKYHLRYAKLYQKNVLINFANISAKHLLPMWSSMLWKKSKETKRWEWNMALERFKWKNLVPGHTPIFRVLLHTQSLKFKLRSRRWFHQFLFLNMALLLFLRRYSNEIFLVLIRSFENDFWGNSIITVTRRYFIRNSAESQS